MQVDALGDLDAQSIRLLEQLGAGAIEAARLTADFHLRRAELKPGTILTREWNGHPHRVMVVDTGFAWMARLMTTYPRSPSPSPGPNGTARASSGCGTSRRKPDHDGGSKEPCFSFRGPEGRRDGHEKSYPHRQRLQRTGVRSGGDRTKLVSAIPKGRRWLDELVGGAVISIDQIAAREGCSIRQVNMTISLAFLAPALVSAAIEGRLPRGVGVAGLRDAPFEWSRQLAMLGLAS